MEPLAKQPDAEHPSIALAVAKATEAAKQSENNSRALETLSDQFAQFRDTFMREQGEMRGMLKDSMEESNRYRKSLGSRMDTVIASTGEMRREMRVFNDALQEEKNQRKELAETVKDHDTSMAETRGAVNVVKWVVSSMGLSGLLAAIWMYAQFVAAGGGAAMAK